jgi:hypothetical protein
VVAVTSIFHASQANLTAHADARHVIPYVNRLTRAVGYGPAKMAEIAVVQHGTPCEVLAAGNKPAEEAVESVLAGAHHSTSLPAWLRVSCHSWPSPNSMRLCRIPDAPLLIRSSVRLALTSVPRALSASG